MPNARKGRWVVGPGKSLFRKLEREVPDIRIVAEDLGCVNNRVRRLLKWCSYPGMKVLQVAFDGDADNAYLPHNYPTNAVVYTGTHDNSTIAGFIVAKC